MQQSRRDTIDLFALDMRKFYIALQPDGLAAGLAGHCQPVNQNEKEQGLHGCNC